LWKHINDYALKSCIFADSAMLWTSGNTHTHQPKKKNLLRHRTFFDWQ